MLSGETPFGGCSGETLATVRARILEAVLSFEPKHVWNSVSPLAKTFIRDLLVKDSTKRPDAKQCQTHEWMISPDLEQTSSDNNTNSNNIKKDFLSLPVVQSLVNFRSFDNFRKLIYEILSFTLLSDQIGSLRQEFELADQEHTGEITFDALKEVLVHSAKAGNMGEFKEGEVIAIFNSMRVNHLEKSIHYREFLAACLNQCRIDDRNLRLAFDRLDSQRKGYISIDNVLDLMGTE